MICKLLAYFKNKALTYLSILFVVKWLLEHIRKEKWKEYSKEQLQNAFDYY